MIEFNSLPQGSDAWLKARLGVPTTSCFGNIITPTGKRSSKFEDYNDQLLAELIFGESEPFKKTWAMQRGNDLEPEAVSYYEYHYNVKTKIMDFVTTDDGRIGCSPDRYVGDDGLLEVKCPLPKQHTKNLLSGQIDMKYYPQVQGQMLITGRSWCDWISYHPDTSASIIRVEKDEGYQNTLKELLNEFCELTDKKLSILKTKGVEFKCQVKPYNPYAVVDVEG